MAFFGSFFNCLQGLVISKIQIFALQNSIRLNPTFLQNAILSVMNIKTNIHLLSPYGGIVKFRHTLLRASLLFEKLLLSLLINLDQFYSRQGYPYTTIV